LCQLPLGALPGDREGTYLLEEHAFSYVASAPELVRTLRQEAPLETPGGFLAVGNVDFEQLPEPTDDIPAPAKLLATRSLNIAPKLRSGFIALPGTGLEVERAVALYQRQFTQPRVKLATKRAAGETRVKEELEAGWSVVHIATHGFFESPERLRNMLRAEQRAEGLAGTGVTITDGTDVGALAPLLKSGLALTGAARIRQPFAPEQIASGELPDDGILTAEEIASLSMRGTELVTLSACDTGLGELAAGQGVLGLGRAFHRAGVRTVVSSLWKVDDAATMMLMEEFYTNLWIKKLSKHEALRQAQIAVLNGPQRLAAEQKLAAQVADRGLTGRTKQLVGDLATADSISTSPHRNHPAYWAAFVLSGSPE
jgi:CHAT domain-containing protein